jgi:hypothetical protein
LSETTIGLLIIKPGEKEVNLPAMEKLITEE